MKYFILLSLILCGFMIQGMEDIDEVGPAPTQFDIILERLIDAIERSNLGGVQSLTPQLLQQGQSENRVVNFALLLERAMRVFNEIILRNFNLPQSGLTDEEIKQYMEQLHAEAIVQFLQSMATFVGISSGTYDSFQLPAPPPDFSNWNIDFGSSFPF